MIRRKYYFYAKVAHNDGSGCYSWHYNFVYNTSFFCRPPKAMAIAVYDTIEALQDRVPRNIAAEDIEVITFNRV